MVYMAKRYRIFLVTLFAAASLYSPMASAAEIQGGTVHSDITNTAKTDLVEAQSLDTANRALRGFLAQYSLTLETSCGATVGYMCISPTDTDLETYRALSSAFVEEWSKYPPEWVAHTRLKSITLIKNLSMKYVTDDSARRAATPSPEASTMVYDITYGIPYMREVFHHEFEHYISYMRYNGQYYHRDAEWDSYNPAGFTYGKGGSSCYTDGVCNLSRDHPAEGFATGYSMSGQEEDRAEIYSFLFTTGSYDTLMKWASTDQSLAKKVAWYKRYIVSVVPSMNDAYFAGEQQSQVPHTDKEPATTATPATTTKPDKSFLRMAMWVLIGFAIFLTFTLVTVGVVVVILARHKEKRPGN